MRVARNIAIVMLLALVVAVVPGGGEAARGISAAITVTFLALIAIAVYVAFRQNRYSYMSLPDQTRTIFLLALGGLVVCLAGSDELTDTSLGLIVFLMVLASSIYGLVRVVVDSRSL